MSNLGQEQEIKYDRHPEEKRQPEIEVKIGKNKQQSGLDQFFKLTERATDVKTEILAGITTFVSMSYIIFVIPMMLADAGMPRDATLAATIFVALFATIVFALWSNFPAAVAPGIGLVAFFTYTVVIGEGLTWQAGLGAVFISGIVFLILTITGIRTMIIYGIPDSLKSAITVGIGLFITFLGLQNAGLVISDESNIVAIGDITATGPLLSLFGLIIAGILTARNVKGGLLLAILLTSAVSMIVGYTDSPSSIGEVFSLNIPSFSETFLAMDLGAAVGFGIVSIILSFTLVELFDNTGTLIGFAKKAKLVRKDGKIDGIDRALQADAAGTLLSASLGGTALNAYAENATGIAEGGRTGLKALVVAALFGCTLFIAPLISYIPTEAIAPALILVGAFMLPEIKNIAFDDFTIVIPVMLTIIMMPLTFSIAEGLAFGFISYTLLKLGTGQMKQIHPVMYFVTAAFILHFII
ncbi:NCS2 family permease [Virgibacillus alimentarius]|uniref:AGZA family xanthine/uracil permease-like MFS transporter n=1 Tax=Virgibacillus alimentarius TaxID=698769 RepID=A0ABS4S5Z8_9BACI|nr:MULTISPECIES: NCS2 family permease [Virgibacillus]MBP2256932.1 AGZA family xanthine/uracil permease-like MFS transporter [Virgibacillus alimentarius]HLR68078.1 NCS2 family permease [Virgibacillus sp.]